VLFSVPEDNLPDIISRVRAGATLTVEAYDRANTRKLATGQLGTIDNVIDTTTGTLKLRAMFANPDVLLYPNQFVNARLLVNTMQNTVRVPVQAVLSGLAVGDRVVTDGTDRLRDGAAVTLPAAQKAGQPAAGGQQPAGGQPGVAAPAAATPAEPNAQHGQHRQPQAQ